jgi:hypothetical protein
MTPEIVIHHHPCPDGFTAAWAIRKRFGDNPTYVPAKHGETPPDVTGKHVVIVDFSYKRDVLETMFSKAASLIVIDHHKSAEADLTNIGPTPAPTTWDAWVAYCSASEKMTPGGAKAAAWFNMDMSGAGMAWRFFHPDKPMPRLVQHVEDRDLWRFALTGSRLIHAVIVSHPYSFAIWDEMAERAESYEGMSELLSEGIAIERANTKVVEEMLPIVRRAMKIGGITVPVANMPYHLASDSAGAMAVGQPFAATYYDRVDGRVFSLRSKSGGVDVSKIATLYGGGGHQHAAGFTMPHGWNGDL